MNKAFLFVIMLVSISFVGCIEDSSEDTVIEDNSVDESTQEEKQNGDDTQGENVNDELITPVGNSANSKPHVDAGIWENDGDKYVIYDGLKDDDDDFDNASFSVHVHWSAIDYDGTIANAGFDLNLDQTIDVVVDEDAGTFVKDQTPIPGALTLNNNASNDPEVTWSIDSVRQHQYGCAISLHTSFMFIAEDNNGSISSDLIHYVHERNLDFDRMEYYMETGLFGLTESHFNMFNTTDCANGPELPVELEFYELDNYNGKNTYQIDYINRVVFLTDVSFFLKDASGSTYVGGNGFGEVAMQYQGGQEMGIDKSYIWRGDDQNLLARAQIINDDDGSLYPVHFVNYNDNNLLSSGDEFYVYGSSQNSNGPAETGWTLELVFDPTGDVIASLPIDFT
tara:strand:+ start:331 stop:1515 length:1185 start_codon:yes stop_codon:yes gene_type:complete